MGYWFNSEEELKAKIGQLLYNMYLVDRLKAELLEKLSVRNQVSMRIELGQDKTGNDVVLDVFLNRFSPKVKEMKEDTGVPEPMVQESTSNPPEELKENSSP
ncbi:MAG: hypothetical protein FJ358_07645 [Thaumarchaeota archaeon]|nr:hypothetical protein [Nitrososphaerota archaeon]